MQLHQLQPKHKPKKKKRVGRGGKRGTYSGRGVKGQKARAGTRKIQPIIREAIKKYPKLRGYRFKVLKKRLVIVNLEVLNKKFKESEVISPQSLLKKRIIRRIKGKVPKVKILGEGKLTKKLKFKDCEMSEGAKSKIKNQKSK